MNKPFFSIVIPVYNVEMYLHTCVDSVLAQTFTNFEVILVDDGSPDRCPSMCDEYANKDLRIRVIHKKNGGLSDARNRGVLASQGQYLIFLDSDDYWDDPDALYKVYGSLTTHGCWADVAIFQAKLLYPDGTLVPDQGVFPDHFNSMNAEDALVYMMQHGLLIASACTKVIKRSFFVDHELFFKVGIRSEDIDWIIRVADCLPRYIYLDQFFYIYRKGRNESITSNVDAAYLNQFADMLEEFATNYVYQNETVRNCLLSLVAYEFSILMAKTANLADEKKRKQLTSRIRKLRHVLRYDMHPKVKKINMVKKLIGFDSVMFLLGVYLKYRKR